jgi:hypothetical protein
MRKSRRVARRAILSSLIDHVHRHYGIEWDRDAVLTGLLTLPEIDALLAFKSDPRLDELRCALVRLEAGSYGTCCRCKRRIPQEILDADPAERFCAACEQTLAAQMRQPSRRQDIQLPQLT